MIAASLGFTVPITTYAEYVAVTLNEAYRDVKESLRLVDAFRIALGHATVPPEWYDVIGATDAERALWQAQELGAQLRRDG